MFREKGRPKKWGEDIIESDMWWAVVSEKGEGVLWKLSIRRANPKYMGKSV